MTTRPQWTAWASASSNDAVTTTPLPAASPSFFTTYGGPKVLSATSASAWVVATSDAAVGTPAAAITCLAKALDPFELGCGGRRAEAGDTGRADSVGDARDQRGLRPDDDQVHALLDSERRDRRRSRAGRRQRSEAAAAMPGLPGAATNPVTSGSRPARRPARARGRPRR